MAAPTEETTIPREQEQQQQGEDDTNSDNFVYVDDNGVAIPPEAEASVLMAMELGEMTAEVSTEWLMVSDGNDASAITLDSVALGSAIEEATKAAEEASESEAKAADDAEPKVEGGEEEEDEYEDEEDGEMIESAMGSRGYSDMGEDEEWVLERLVRRRLTKNLDKEARTWEYLCKWKWYAEVTWEAREFLEEEGYGKQLDAFDAERAPQKKSAPKVVTKKNINFDTVIEKRFPNLPGLVAAAFKNVSRRATRYANVAGGAPAARFFNSWSATKTPVILFHGTRKANMPSIINNGLVVPGHYGVTVANGSAYGVGIYTARDPGIPCGYSRDSNLMFACLGFVDSSSAVRCSGNICVFFQSHLVMPLYLVEFDSDHHPRPFERVEVSDLLGPIDLSQHTLPSLPHGVGAPRGATTIPARPDGRSIPKDLLQKHGITKRMIKQAPRYLKDLYKEGALKQRKNDWK